MMIDNSAKHASRLLSEFFALSAEQAYQAALAANDAPFKINGVVVVPLASFAAWSAAITAAQLARDGTRAIAVTLAGRAVGHDRGGV
jgi:hypothetical protein